MDSKPNRKSKLKKIIVLRILGVGMWGITQDEWAYIDSRIGEIGK